VSIKAREKKALSNSPPHKQCRELGGRSVATKVQSDKSGSSTSKAVPNDSHSAELFSIRKSQSRTPTRLMSKSTSRKSVSKSPDHLNKTSAARRRSKSRSPRIASREAQSKSSNSLPSRNTVAQKCPPRRSRSRSVDNFSRRDKSSRRSRSRSANNTAKRKESSRRSRSCSPLKTVASSIKLPPHSQGSFSTSRASPSLHRSRSPKTLHKKAEQPRKSRSLSRERHSKTQHKSSTYSVTSSVKKVNSSRELRSLSPDRSNKKMSALSPLKKSNVSKSPASRRSPSPKRSSYKHETVRRSGTQSPKHTDKIKNLSQKSRSRSPIRHDKSKPSRSRKSRSKSPYSGNKSKNNSSKRSRSRSPTMHGKSKPEHRSRSRDRINKLKDQTSHKPAAHSVKSSSKATKNTLARKTRSRSPEKSNRVNIASSRRSRSPPPRPIHVSANSRLSGVRSAASNSSSSFSSSSSDSELSQSRSRSPSSDSPVSVAKLNRPYAVGLAAELSHRRSKLLELRGKEILSSHSTPLSGFQNNEAIVIETDDEEVNSLSDSSDDQLVFTGTTDKTSTDSDVPKVVMSESELMNRLEKQSPAKPLIPTANIPLPPGPKRAPWSASKKNAVKVTNEVVTLMDSSKRDESVNLGNEQTAHDETSKSLIPASEVIPPECIAVKSACEEIKCASPSVYTSSAEKKSDAPISLIKLPLPPVGSDGDSSESSESEESTKSSRVSSPPRYGVLSV